MDKSSILYQALREENEELKKRVDVLEKGAKLMLKLFNKNADRVHEYLLRLQRGHFDNEGRIMQLEAKVFPNLKYSLEHLRRTIGDDDGPVINPLDSKKKKK